MTASKIFAVRSVMLAHYTAVGSRVNRLPKSYQVIDGMKINWYIMDSFWRRCIVDREPLLSVITEKLADLLTEAARRLGVIAANEMIFLGASVIPVQKSDPEILAMNVHTYFTAERLQSAGIDPLVYMGRILNACDRRDVTTVAELIALGRKKFLTTKGAGHRSCDAIQTLFQHDDITGF
jgi:hypothetical protein